MASATEQLASQINWSSFTKAQDLKARIFFTLGALIIFRLGTHIPLPGVNAKALADFFGAMSQGVVGMLDMFSGGAIQRGAIFTLGIVPYITASIAMQLLSFSVPQLAQLKKEGELGKRKINQYTRYLAVILCIIQGYGVSVGLETMVSNGFGAVVADSGLYFRITTVVTLLGGTMFLMWLGEQITSRGIGNGSSLFIFAGIAASIPTNIAKMLEMGKVGAISVPILVLVPVALIGLFFVIVYFERAQRRITVQYPKRQVGAKVFGGESSHLPLKLNTTGILAPILASALLSFPMTFIGFTGHQATGWFADILPYLQHGSPVFMLIFAVLIVCFNFMFTAHLMNPVETAENLRKAGGFIPGIRPGSHTADYIDFVLTRVTVIGVTYLVVICLFPDFLMAGLGTSLFMGGTALLLLVTVPMDTITQIHSYLIAHQYEGLIRKSRLKGSKKK